MADRTLPCPKTRNAAPTAACRANPATAPALIEALRGINPWVKDADFDHHGYGVVEAGSGSLRCTFKRVAGTKVRSRAKLPTAQFSYRLAKGQKSIL